MAISRGQSPIDVYVVEVRKRLDFAKLKLPSNALPDVEPFVVLCHSDCVVNILGDDQINSQKRRGLF